MVRPPSPPAALGRSPRLRTSGLAAGLALVLGVAAAACGVVDQTPPPPGCPTGPPDALTGTIFNRANADRGAAGLGELSWSPRLACLGSEWSRHMAATGQLGHRDLGATIRSPGFEGYTGLAENVYVGPGGASGDAVHDLWMASAGHRGNILGSFDTTGIGWARSGDGRLWVTGNYGRH